MSAPPVAFRDAGNLPQPRIPVRSAPRRTARFTLRTLARAGRSPRIERIAYDLPSFLRDDVWPSCSWRCRTDARADVARPGSRFGKLCELIANKQKMLDESSRRT